MEAFLFSPNLQPLRVFFMINIRTLSARKVRLQTPPSVMICNSKPFRKRLQWCLLLSGSGSLVEGLRSDFFLLWKSVPTFLQKEGSHPCTGTGFPFEHSVPFELLDPGVSSVSRSCSVTDQGEWYKSAVCNQPASLSRGSPEQGLREPHGISLLLMTDFIMLPPLAKIFAFGL